MLALAMIIFFGEVFNFSSKVEVGAVLVSGRLTAILFNEVIKSAKFKGWDKIKKSEKIKLSVDNYMKQFEGFERAKATIITYV